MNRKSDFNTDSEVMTLEQTASALGVSQATVVNWIKHSYVKPLSEAKPIVFNSKEVISLKSNISNGYIKRLHKRANKMKSGRTFIPAEYLKDSVSVAEIQDIVFFIQKNGIDSNVALLLLCLNLLAREGILLDKCGIGTRPITKLSFNNAQIGIEINDWLKQIKDQETLSSHRFLLEVRIPKQKDILGLIYQSLLLEGNKAKNGLYYTPQNIVDDIVKEYASGSCKFLDPCCGSGQFILAAADIVEDPNNLFGIDIDETAVRIARINMLMRFKNIRFVPNVYHRNTLLDFNTNNLSNKQNHSLDNFDLIATNPPWGAHFRKEDKALLREQYAHINSFESFSYFLSKSIDLLKENGILSFILPESILNVEKHKDIRSQILSNCCIEKIAYLDRVFKNVFTPVIRLDIRKARKDSSTFLIFKNGKSYKLEQGRLLNNQDFIFDIHSNDFDSHIIDKVYSAPHLTLKGNAEWALGIVTGDNEKYVHSKKEKGLEEVFKGKDVERFIFKPATSYIHFTPNKFQQVAAEVKYRAKEKLVYRFISKYLIFAYDDKQRLTLNSANILIPQIDNYSIKVIAALFNSSLYQFIFQKKFASIKVLRSHLEQLPLPLWDGDTLDKICSMVQRIIDSQHDINELNSFVMKLFNLSDVEISYIKKSLSII